jgi:hypothetical protein
VIGAGVLVVGADAIGGVTAAKMTGAVQRVAMLDAKSVSEAVRAYPATETGLRLRTRATPAVS